MDKRTFAHGILKKLDEIDQEFIRATRKNPGGTPEWSIPIEIRLVILRERLREML